MECILPGDALPETNQLLMVLGSLEHFVPRVLAEVHPHWKFESLDGFYLAEAKKIGEDLAELRGQCILICDQTLTPFHLRMHVAAMADEIDWMECRVGKCGTGAGGMERVAWADWNGRTDRYLQESLKVIDWAYAVTFGERE